MWEICIEEPSFKAPSLLRYQIPGSSFLRQIPAPGNFSGEDSN